MTPSLAAASCTAGAAPTWGPAAAPARRPGAVGAESGPGRRGAGGAGMPARGLGCAAAPGPVQRGRALVQPPVPSRMGDWE